MFVLLSIVSKLGIQDDVIAMLEQSESIITPERLVSLKKQYPKEEDFKKAVSDEVSKVIEKRGMITMAKLAIKVMSNLIHVRGEVNEFLATLCGVTVKDIREMKAPDYTNLIVAFFKQPEFLEVFKSLASLMSLEVVTSKTEPTH